jgi:hypothetical protein
MATFMDYLQEAHHRLDRARMLDDEANRTGLAFVTTELAVSRRFAEAALTAFSAGDRGDAKQAAWAAKATYHAVQRFLPKLLVQGEERAQVVRKLGDLTPLIEQLSTGNDFDVRGVIRQCGVCGTV